MEEQGVRLDRWLALGLILVCLMAALGNWLGVGRPAVPSPAAGRPVVASAGRPDIALLPIYGPITHEAQASPFGEGSTSSANNLIRAIRRAEQDQVKAILLSVNSPGGTAAASQAIYEELMRVRKASKIKIVATFGDVAASGGYYVASAADHIVSNPASITGSIGVIIQVQNLTGLLEKIGVKTTTVKSGAFKDLASPFRPTSPAEQQLLQQFVDESYQQFLDAILAGRSGKLTLAQLKPVADGRILTGTQALKARLVDSLGNYADAVQKAAELAGLKGEPRVRNYATAGLRESLESLFSLSLDRWVPGVRQVRAFQTTWNRVPLTLMD